VTYDGSQPACQWLQPTHVAQALAMACVPALAAVAS